MQNFVSNFGDKYNKVMFQLTISINTNQGYKLPEEINIRSVLCCANLCVTEMLRRYQIIKEMITLHT